MAITPRYAHGIGKVMLISSQLASPHTGYAFSNIQNRIIVIDLIQYEIILFYLCMLTVKK